MTMDGGYIFDDSSFIGISHRTILSITALTLLVARCSL